MTGDTVARPRRASWTRLQIVLHWLTVLFILAQFFNHGWMEEAWDALLDGEAAEPGTLGPALLLCRTAPLVLAQPLGSGDTRRLIDIKCYDRSLKGMLD